MTGHSFISVLLYESVANHQVLVQFTSYKSNGTIRGIILKKKGCEEFYTESIVIKTVVLA